MIAVRPATDYADVAAVIGPRSPTANVCWCLSHRLPSARNKALVGPERGAYVRDLCAANPPPGVVAYDGDDPVGWAAVAPRRDTAYARSRTIPAVDDLDVWTVWCFRVRPGHRGRGISAALLDGAVELARAYGAPAVEGYPVDNGGRPVDPTMAYVGTRALFERAGFVHAADTRSVLAGFPRVVVRRTP